MLRLSSGRDVRVAVAGFASLAIASLAAAQEHKPAEPAAARLVTVAAVDETGGPLPQAQAYLIDNPYSLPMSKAWVVADAKGEAAITTGDVDASLLGDTGSMPATLVVKAPGRAWAIKSLTLPASDTIQVALPVGRAVEIALKPADGMTLPKDLQPVIYAEGLSVAAWLANVQRAVSESSPATPSALFNPTIPELNEAGRFRVHLQATARRSGC